MEGALDKSYQLVTKLSAHLGSHQLRPLGCGLIFHDPRLCSVGFLDHFYALSPSNTAKPVRRQGVSSEVHWGTAMRQPVVCTSCRGRIRSIYRHMIFASSKLRL